MFMTEFNVLVSLFDNGLAEEVAVLVMFKRLLEGLW